MAGSKPGFRVIMGNMTNRDQSRPGLRRREAIALLAAVGGVMGLILSAPGEAAAQTLSVDETVTLVRGVYYEGMPEEQAERIGPDGCAQLIEMLADPRESRSHAQVLLAIGICHPSGGFEAIRDWADTPREGEIDRATFRTWQALPAALGRLARHDPRALARLEAQLNESEAPTWTFRHHRGARLVSQSRRSAATWLARTGLPEAGAALDRVRGDASDQRFRDHLEGARRLHRESAGGLGLDAGRGAETGRGAEAASAEAGRPQTGRGADPARDAYIRGGFQGTAR